MLMEVMSATPQKRDEMVHAVKIYVPSLFVQKHP